MNRRSRVAVLSLGSVILGACAERPTSTSHITGDATAGSQWTQEAYYASLYHRGNDNENEVDATGNPNYLTAMHKVRMKVEAADARPRKKRVTIYYSVIVPRHIQEDGEEGLVFETSMARNFSVVTTRGGDTVSRKLKFSDTENPTPTFHNAISFEKVISASEPADFAGRVYVAYEGSEGFDQWHQRVDWQASFAETGEFSGGELRLEGNPDLYPPSERRLGKKPGEIRLVESNFIPKSRWQTPLKAKVGYSRAQDPDDDLQAEVGASQEERNGNEDAEGDFN